MADFLPLDGILKGKDPATGNKVQLTAVQDTNGDWVLRVVNASPYFGFKKAIPALTTLSETLNIVAGGTKNFTITPPVGEIWRIKLIGLDVPIPVGATSGSHTVQLFYGAINNLNAIIEISNAFGAKITIRGNNPLVKNACTPLTDSEFGNQIRSIAISASNPLIILYTNSTNVPQTGVFGLKITKEIEYTD